MTTIVYRFGVMAGDTAVFDRGVYCGETRKVFRNEQGALLGVCGCMSALAQLRDWFIAGGEGDPPELKDHDSEGLLIRPDGAAEWIGAGRKRIEMTGDFFAIGSGFSIAMGALHAGATARRAAEIACDLDSHTQRPIHVVTAYVG